VVSPLQRMRSHFKAACRYMAVLFIFSLLFGSPAASPAVYAGESSRTPVSSNPSETNDPHRPEPDTDFCDVQPAYDLDALQDLLPKLSRHSRADTDDLPQMIARKTVRVLTTYSMTNYFVIQGQTFGHEYSLLKQYERFLNQNAARRHPQVVLEFLPIPENLLIPSLLKGLGDIVAAGLTIAPELERHAEFTEPYFTGSHDVVVYNPKIGDLARLSDLAGKQIYVRPIRHFYDTLSRINDRLNALDLPPLRIVKADGFLTTKDILELVNAGIVDFSLAKKHLVERWSEVMPHIQIASQLAIGGHEGLGWMVRKNNPELKASLNTFIEAHKKGTFYGNLYFKRYYQNPGWIDNPLNQDDIIKFSHYAPLFKKYGRMYEIDWMLLAALAYQESRFNQNSRSHVGAVGVMQVLPSTAQDARIRVKDIHLPENNVHAGAKYLAMLREHYFAEENIPPEERIYFALAAYNAGPRKIIQCRRIAQEQGLDANRWFGHVEMGAYRIIGEETPRYVSNVAKYFLAYRLSDTLDCLKNKEIEKLNRERLRDET